MYAKKNSIHMKKLLIGCSLVFASALTMQASAQQTQVNNSKAVNVYYNQDPPYIGVAAQDKKLASLEKQFKSYEKAMDKNNTAQAIKIKTSIYQWKSENKAWLDQLQPDQVKNINDWFQRAEMSLRLYDELK